MKRFDPFTLDRVALRDELSAFEKLLGPDTKELSERNDILPFFKRNLNLASLIGFAKSHLTFPDVIKTEFPLVGDHACDLAVGEKQDGKGLFCFVEFEDAEAGSIFRQVAKGTPDWSPRLEHGFSQIVDWFYILADQSQTKLFRDFFGTDLADYCGLLVIGRDGFLAESTHARLRWRSQNTLVGGKPVSIITFDQLLRNLRARVELCSKPADSQKHVRRQKSGTRSRRKRKK
ncbi:MAG: DUF4263 domain-containing protein [Planctomycetia bacterium]|nr:DUF4263 domain-containing protein [Planctomycetia bacterium]